LLSSKSRPRRGLRIVGQIEIVAGQQIMSAHGVGMAGRLGRFDLLLGANLEIGTLVFGHFIPSGELTVSNPLRGPNARSNNRFQVFD
jgi:hypothetical protein